MKIGVLQLQLRIAGAHSLKHKRSKLAEIKNLLRKKFNISIVGLSDGENQQSAKIGIALLGRGSKYINSTFEEILGNFKDRKDMYIMDYNIQLI